MAQPYIKEQELFFDYGTPLRISAILGVSVVSSVPGDECPLRVTTDNHAHLTPCYVTPGVSTVRLIREIII
jgi:hypothetical protein